MNLFTLLFRPSLVRRVTMTLMLASISIWAVLIAYYYWQETSRNTTQSKQRDRGELVISVLKNIDHSEQARDAAAWYSALFSAQYARAGLPDKFVLQLQDRTGRILFSSNTATQLHLQVTEIGMIEHNLHGETYQIYRAESGPWILHIGESAPDRGLLLARISSNLTMSVLISFPLILLPIWFAVARGMRPLQTLSNHIATRGPDDLSALQLDVKYAELLPLANALDRLLNQLRTKLSREHGFVQDAAHELRTPMAVISAQAHVMMMADEPEQRRQAAQHLEDAIIRASHLIRQLLDLARIDNQETHTIELLDLCQVLRQALAELAPIALERRIELSLDAPDELYLHVDRHAFLSIVHNLIGNALYYGPDDGQGQIEIGLVENNVVLSIADDGPGIPEDLRSQVFERFYRLAGTKKSGSGLGLAIVAQAVASLHGSVRIETGLDGRGCRFIVELPKV